MIKVYVTNDALEAYMILQYNELEGEERSKLVDVIKIAIKEADINYGIIQDAFRGELPFNTPILIAKGDPPVHGQDSQIKMYEIESPKPKLIENDKVNHYELSLIHHVKVGDWLGERTDPTPGTPGMDVHGNIIAPIKGLSHPLIFDRRSVEQVREGDKDVLYSLKNGAVNYVGDSIAVYDVMEVKGDVDFNIGNIDFNGYVNIKGTIEENFSVKARDDIEISGIYGVGGASKIESAKGNIYIRGGVAGKNKTKIICKKNLYVKYLSDVEVHCEGTVFIGFYARNAYIRAKRVIVESIKGQIAGGLIDADIRIDSADVGNRMEMRTLINIRGFDRFAMQNTLDEMTSELKQKKKQLAKCKNKQRSGNLDTKTNADAVAKLREEIFLLQKDIKNLEYECLNVVNYLKTPGDGALIVRNTIYPRVKITICEEALEISEKNISQTYILKEGTIQPL